MFYGSYLHTLDDKNRLLLPSKIRDGIKNHLYMMKGFDGAISLYEEDKFLSLMEKLSELSFNKVDTRNYIRAQLANTYELDIDKLGRIQIPTAIKAKFNITKEVMVLGAIDHIEIWDRAKFIEYQDNIEASFESIAEKI